MTDDELKKCWIDEISQDINVYEMKVESYRERIAQCQKMIDCCQEQIQKRERLIERIKGMNFHQRGMRNESNV